MWCQGFSEPDAGSDLASLRTRAVRDGDDYVVTGSKIWTSHAEVADFCELLVRTGRGSATAASRWLIMPMDSPGIEIRPAAHHRRARPSSPSSSSTRCGCPVANRVGDENDGWRVTMVTLSFERGTAFVGELLECIGSCRRGGAGPPHRRLDDAGVRRRVGHLVAAFDALWALTRRNVSQAARTGIPGIGGTDFKLAFSETRSARRVSLSLLGRAGLAADDVEAGDGSGPLPSATMVEDWCRASR